MGSQYIYIVSIYIIYIYIPHWPTLIIESWQARMLHVELQRVEELWLILAGALEPWSYLCHVARLMKKGVILPMDVEICGSRGMNQTF